MVCNYAHSVDAQHESTKRLDLSSRLLDLLNSPTAMATVNDHRLLLKDIEARRHGLNWRWASWLVTSTSWRRGSEMASISLALSSVSCYLVVVCMLLPFVCCCRLYVVVVCMLLSSVSRCRLYHVVVCILLPFVSCSSVISVRVPWYWVNSWHNPHIFQQHYSPYPSTTTLGSVKLQLHNVYKDIDGLQLPLGSRIE